MFVLQKQQIGEGSDSLVWTMPSVLCEAEDLMHVPYREVIRTAEEVCLNF